MTAWSEYPKQIQAAKARLNVLDIVSPGIKEQVMHELDGYGPDRMAATIEKFREMGLFGDDPYTDGVDNSPEGIEQARTELIKQRNRMLGAGVMEQAAFLTHVLVLLAELKDIKEHHAALPDAIRNLKTQAQNDLKNMEKE